MTRRLGLRDWVDPEEGRPRNFAAAFTNAGQVHRLEASSMSTKMSTDTVCDELADMAEFSAIVDDPMGLRADRYGRLIRPRAYEFSQFAWGDGARVRVNKHPRFRSDNTVWG